MVDAEACIWASVLATWVQFLGGHLGRHLSYPHMWQLAVPSEQGESSSTLVLMAMVSNPQPASYYCIPSIQTKKNMHYFEYA